MDKPLDFGDGGITGSLNHRGELIALNTYHPEHGYITLTSAPLFAEEARYRSNAVRAYRASLAEIDGFGIQFEMPVQSLKSELLQDVIPQFTWTLADDTRSQMTAFATSDGVFQIWQLSRPAVLQGTLSLQRCAYTQLTEGGPLPFPSGATKASFQDGLLALTNAYLPQTVAIAGLQSPDWHIDETEQVELKFSLPEGETCLIFAFGATLSIASRKLQVLTETDVHFLLQEKLRVWEKRWQGIPNDKLIRRGLSYGLALSIPIEETTCILTDHMLLPLSWNRDAYYVAHAFLQWEIPEAIEAVRRHLLWMFEKAERHKYQWGRAYLANGNIKDHGFQLDQQIFPLLEFVEYLQATGDSVTDRRLRAAVKVTVEHLLQQRTREDIWLFPTSETPADDPITLPYHLSSHILLAYTLSQLAEYGFVAHEVGEQVQKAIQHYFIAEHQGQKLYAYATDGQHNYHFYHDANDIPTVLAPLWGIISQHDPVWQATIEFAFSEQNAGGHYDGHSGSVHTAAPWPLGDIQALIVARIYKDHDSEQAALTALQKAAQIDGALPEAYDAKTFDVVSRHWFAWPGVLFASVELNKNKGGF